MDEAERIEMAAAERAYAASFGVSEWEAFLTTDEVKQLIMLAESGFGTWGREPDTLARMEESLYGRN